MMRQNRHLRLNNNQYIGVYINGLALFSNSVLRNSSDTWNIGSTWCRYIDGYRQMADNRIHHPGGNIAHIWRLIPLRAITAWNLGFVLFALTHCD